MIKGTTQSVPLTLKKRHDLPLQMKCDVLESHACTFKSLTAEFNRHVLGYFGTWGRVNSLPVKMVHHFDE